MRRLARRCLTAWKQLLARRRCTLGAGAVVYNPALVRSVAGNRTAIHIGRLSQIRGELLALPGGHLSIGEWCYLGEHSRIWAYSNIRIGDRVLIAHNVSILDSQTHPMEETARHNHFKAIVLDGHLERRDLGARPIVIEDDVWIGCNAVVLRGVRIGHGAIVGAGSVVTHDVPGHVVVAGNPARVVRQLAAEQEKQS